MSNTVDKTFTATGQSALLLRRHGQSLRYSVSGTFSGTVVLERSLNGGSSWEAVLSASAAASGTILCENPTRSDMNYRFRCSVYSSGSIVTQIAAALTGTKLITHAAGLAKVGATSGFDVAPADNRSEVTCPQSKTGSTLVIPIQGLKKGDKINGFHLIGLFTGNTGSIDANLRYHTPSPDADDVSVASMAQLSIPSTTLLSESNTVRDGFEEEVTDDRVYYLLVTVTTAAGTTLSIHGVAVSVTPAP